MNDDIAVHPDVDRSIRDRPENIVIQVRDLSDPVLGAAALDRARVAIMNQGHLASQAAYAFVTIEPSFTLLELPLSATDWTNEQGGASDLSVAALCDEIVLDAFPYQILGPGHLRRLAASSSDPSPMDVLRPVSAGRHELRVAEPSAWLFTSNPEYLTPALALPPATTGTRRPMRAPLQRHGGGG